MYLLVYIKGGSNIYIVVVYLKPKKTPALAFFRPKDSRTVYFFLCICVLPGWNVMVCLLVEKRNYTSILTFLLLLVILLFNQTLLIQLIPYR